MRMRDGFGHGVWCWLVVLCCMATVVQAHPARMTVGTASVRPDGEVRVRLSVDILAYLLNDTPARVTDEAMLALVDGPDEALDQQVEEAKERAPSSLRVLVDGGRVPMEIVAFPTGAQIKAAANTTTGARLPVMLEIELKGRAPPGSKGLAFRVSDVLDQMILTVERDGKEPLAMPLASGYTSDPLPITVADLMPQTDGPATLPSSSLPHSTSPESREPGILSVAWQYLVLGFEHILPKGLDHILFILGLFLLSTRIKPLLWQVTAFTLAHSITLALAITGHVRIAPEIVEPVIALSIAWIAIENIMTREMKPWRPGVVFAFGLLHGLGFASVLTELGLPAGQLAGALIAFNVGVESGQLAVIGVAFLLVGGFRQRAWYRAWVVIPASLAIAATGVYWTFDRIL